MIYYLVSEKHDYTLKDYITSWGTDVAARFQILTYNMLPLLSALAPGTVLLTDIERLNFRQKWMVREFVEQLHASGKFALLNDSPGLLDRLPLLQTLHDRGINPFNARALGDTTRTLTRPAFIRVANDHEGASTNPLTDSQNRTQALMELVMRGIDPSSLMEIEFCDTKDSAGVYRKYSAFRIGQRVIARHVFFSKAWMVKETDLVDPAMVAQQHAYIRDNPHENVVRAIFELARIDYGRIDYGILNGKIVVWEINTNPLILWPVTKYKPEILPAYQIFADRFRDAVIELDEKGKSGVPNSQPLQLRWSNPMITQMITPGGKL